MIGKEEIKKLIMKEYNITATKQINDLLDYLLDVLESSKISYKTMNYDMKEEHHTECSLDYVVNEIIGDIDCE